MTIHIESSMIGKFHPEIVMIDKIPRVAPMSDEVLDKRNEKLILILGEKTVPQHILIKKIATINRGEMMSLY